jgi:protein ImuB
MNIACLYFQKETSIQELAQACLRFSPQISVREPNAIFIEIGKCRALYSEESFRARVQVLFRKFKADGRIAIASDIPSALALAHFNVKEKACLPLEAVEDFGDPFRLDPVARKTLAKMTESLKRLGIETLTQFQGIDPKLLPSRFGSIGLYCRQQSEDASRLAWPHWEPPEIYSERLELLPQDHLADIEPLLFASKEALDRLFSRLRGKFLRAEKIEVKLELERYSTVKRPTRDWTFEFISPQGSTSGFLPILRERLHFDLARDPIESFVTAIECHATSVTHGAASQRNFFHSRDDFNEAMGSLFGQLSEYLGKDRVFWAKVGEERFPERSWNKTRDAKSPQAEIEGHYPLRPTRILDPPVPIAVVENRIRFRGKTLKTKTWSQLERLSLDWLNASPSRTYYHVELETGQAIWVFSDPAELFFVHGYFE